MKTRSPLAHHQVRFELKSAQETDDTLNFVGLASVYDVVDLGGDVVRKGAFTKTINERPEVPILWQHSSFTPIGLGKLSDSEVGLMIEGTIQKAVAAGRDAAVLILAKVVKGLSIGYQTVKDAYPNGGRVRELLELKVWEVSLATLPMNPAAAILNAKGLDPVQAFIEEHQADIAAGRPLDSESMEFLKATIARQSDGLKQLSTLYDAAIAASKAAEPTNEPAAGHSIADQLRQLKEIFTS